MTSARVIKSAEVTEAQLLATTVPPSFEFSMQESLEDAKHLLDKSTSLATLRYELVPGVMSEVDFWRTTFYCIEHTTQGPQQRSKAIETRE